MDSSLMMAYTVITSMKHRDGGALPHALVKVEGRPGPARRRLAPFRGRLAGALHRAAWVIEPAPRSVAETRD